MSMHNPPHPGGILKRQYLEPMNLSITATAESLGVSRKQLSLLLNEKTGVSPQMAIRLGAAFDTTPEFWLNLQRAVDLRNAQRRFRGEIKPLIAQALVQ